MKRNTDLHAQGLKKSVITFNSEPKNVGCVFILVLLLLLLGLVLAGILGKFGKKNSVDPLSPLNVRA